MSFAACALGVRVPELDDAWRGFLRAAQPWGLILFREACVTRAQVARLCKELREAAGHDAIIYIDQEGGRVARMRPPDWPVWPAAAAYGAIYANDKTLGLAAARLGHRLIAHELKAIGVNGDFAPVLDVPVSGADPIIGDRALSTSPDAIAALGQSVLDGLNAGGVAGCVKHMPGHGRATADSHLALPRVSDGLNELGADFAPFRALAKAEMAMTAHIVFDALDPENPATHSKKVINELIRGEVGFEGLLASDDLDMKALDGPLRDRAEKAFAAGCDVVLQCSGVLADTEAVVAGCPKLAGKALARAAKVEEIARRKPDPLDAAEGWWRFRTLLGPGVGLKVS
ncbi:MAG: beta-N-acetylhexosaminidase [Hyphomonadaceae bacterium]